MRGGLVEKIQRNEKRSVKFFCVPRLLLQFESGRRFHLFDVSLPFSSVLSLSSLLWRCCCCSFSCFLLFFFLVRRFLLSVRPKSQLQQ